MDGRTELSSELLKKLRKNCGLSQEAVAENCRKKGIFVSLSSIKRAEAGKNVLYRTAAGLAKFYSVSIETLENAPDSRRTRANSRPHPRTIKPPLF